MDKSFTRIFIAVCFFMLGVSVAAAQTITIRPIDAGPYGPGSSIGVPIKIDFTNGYFTRTGNTFTLYLSDASGNFASQRQIGSITGFYTSYVNGVIPTSNIPAGTNYKVRVVANSREGGGSVTSAESNAFTIGSGAGFDAAISSSSYLQTTSNQYPDIFGLCEGQSNHEFTFTNQTSGATVTANIINENTNASAANISLTPNSASFKAATTNYTITAKAIKGGVVATKSYPLINNRVFTNLGTSGSNVVCKSDNAELPFFIDYESSAGIQNNFPGLVYRIVYGDGLPAETFTIFDIRSKEGRLTHTYNKSSCGFDAGGGRKGVFRVELQSVSPYCGNVGTTSPQYAQVLEPAVNKFEMPATGCVGKPVKITNISNPGQSPSSTTGSCENPNALYTWKFDDGTELRNKKLSDPITHTFTTPGNHKVILVFQPSSVDRCSVADFPLTICIVNPPVPKFTIAATGCTDDNITVSNTSTYDNSNSCTTITPVYRWTVTPSAGVTYESNTSSSSATPVFRFTQPGKYQVTLSITGGCDAVVSNPQEIMVDAAPTASLSPNVTFCQTRLDIPFNETADKTKTVITGTAENESPNYEWTFPTVPAGATAPVFVNSTKNSRYPTIRFDGAGTYVVQIRHRNSCGTVVTRTQQITLRDAPQLDPKFENLICPDATSALDANLTPGTYNTLRWTSSDPNGSFIGGATNPLAQYKPSAAEIAAGEAVIQLTITTDIAGCESIPSSPLRISIKPVNDITTPSAKSICTGTSVNYTIESPVATSTYEWKVVSNSAFVTGFTANGTSKTINDVLVNSSNEVGTVVYEITPINGNCTGKIHKLTVTVDPKPKPQFEIVGNDYGCGPTTITLRNTSPTKSGKFFWDFGDGTPPVEDNRSEFTHDFEPFTNGDGSDRIYAVTLRQENACEGVTTPQQPIRIKPAVPVPLIINPPTKNNDCGRFELTVNNDSKGSDETYIFRLEDENGNLVEREIAQVSEITRTDKGAVKFDVSPRSATTYYVTMTAINKCGARASIPFRWPVTTSVAGVSIMGIEGGKTKACINEEVIFENGSRGTSYRYKIYRENGSVYREFGAPFGQTPFKFTDAGKYKVVVIATVESCGGDAAESKPYPIEVLPSPVAAFSSASVGCSLEVQFNPIAPLDPNFTYTWEFGDGNTSNDPSPKHQYTGSGSYEAKLTVANALGCNDFSQQPVVVRPALKAEFTVLPSQEISLPNYHFSFRDNSEGNPSAWLWKFGNGETSTQQNPEYTYPRTDIGPHKVSLTITRTNADGLQCQDIIEKTVTISGVPGTLFVPNAFMPTANSTILQSFMAKGTGIKNWRMQIFNKWGQLVWETTKLGPNGEPIDGWDGNYKGSPAPQGSYIWQISATFINGTEWKGMSYQDSPPKRSGVINLIR